MSFQNVTNSDISERH